MPATPDATRGARVAEARRRVATLAAIGALLAGAGAAGCRRGETDDPPAPGDAARGEALFAIAAGCGCHTPKEGPVGAGGDAIETPFGTFYATNITSDPVHGIGAWSDVEIERAIRAGTLRDGSVESPVMPWPMYAGMSDRDVHDLVAFLRTLPPSDRADRPAEGTLPFERLAYRAWRLLFGPTVAPPREAPAAGPERGAYLGRHVAGCADCHTPRNRAGVPVAWLELAGVPRGEGLPWAPNVTPDRETGIGDWDAADVENLLATGFTPEFDNVQGAMAESIDGKAGAPGYAKAPAEDRAAIAAWLVSVPPVRRAIPRREPGPGNP